MSDYAKSVVDAIDYQIRYIEAKYGNDGIAVYYQIRIVLNNIHEGYINLSSDIDLMIVSDRLRVSASLFRDIVSDLSLIGFINKKLWKHGIIWSDKMGSKPIHSVADIIENLDLSKKSVVNQDMAYIRECFDVCHGKYPSGKKRSSDTEFKLFISKVKSDRIAVLNKLDTAIVLKAKGIEDAKHHGKFAPEFPAMAVYINQRRWEQDAG